MMNMDNIEMIVNSLPAPTWEKLGMNRATVKGVGLCEKATVTCERDYEIMTADGGCTKACDVCSNSTPTGMGEEVSHLLDASNIETIRIVNPGTTLMRYSFDEGKSEGARFMVSAPRDKELTVLMDYRSQKDAEGSAVVQTLINIEKGAKVHLVQTVRLGQDFKLLNDIGVKCQDGASFELTQLFLSGKEIYTGCQAQLMGDESSMETHLGYKLKGSELLDMNYIAKHIGRKTNSRITASGSLSDTSTKIFRGTIDFVKGAVDAVGNENEEVLIIDDGTVNKTIPLILCAEENVEGNHGASIGRPDEDILFYMQSRGITKEQAIEILSLAKVDAAAAHITDDAFRKEILDTIHGTDDEVV